VASRVKEGFLPLCSPLVGPHLESRVQLWSPQHRKDMEPVGVGPGVKRRQWEDLIAAFQYLKGAYK